MPLYEALRHPELTSSGDSTLLEVESIKSKVKWFSVIQEQYIFHTIPIFHRVNKKVIIKSNQKYAFSNLKEYFYSYFAIA